MPLSDHEQKVLQEIEKRLQEEDPRFADQYARHSLHSHLARRIRWGVLGFVTGFVMLILFVVSVWVALIGFCVMLVSALFVYQQLRHMGREQIRAISTSERTSLAGLLARLTQRFRGDTKPPAG
jgi:hypothetical protein